ncbi:MAG: AraC family transcriptional regulator [Lachnospiraceae bacterium]|nr:AraC family transcriptional regulator [Lachnospiraceae bacterium]
MKEIFDEYCWTKQKKVLIYDNHHVKGLGNFAHWNFTESINPSPMHIHSNMIEMHCMVKGQRYTQIEKDGDITRYICTGNQAFLTFPFEIHSNGNIPQSPCEFYAFQIDVSDPNNMLGLSPEYSRNLYDQLKQLKSHHLNLTSSHMNYVISAFNFFSEKNPDSTKIGVQFLTCFLFTLQYLQPVENADKRETDPGIASSVDYIKSHLSDNLRLSELADVSGYSLSRFKFKFKEEIGITPAEYITLQKVEQAKNQLISTDQSITELAYSLGFSTSNYFSSVFKKILSCTPKEYRRLYQSGNNAV